MTKTLYDTWIEKINIANHSNLTIFIFKFNDNTYITEWIKNQWRDPYLITTL